VIPTATNSNALVTLVLDAGLYKNLLDQLIKDFELSGLSFDINLSISPTELVMFLNNKLELLLQNHFDSYMQLLYRVDIPEHSIQDDGIQDMSKVAQNATFIILQREWQKVYFKNQYS
jgi:hypothetical protein